MMTLLRYCNTIKNFTLRFDDRISNLFLYLISKLTCPNIQSIKANKLNGQIIQVLGKYCPHLTKIKGESQTDLTFEILVENIPLLNSIVIPNLKSSQFDSMTLNSNDKTKLVIFGNIVETMLDTLSINTSKYFPNLTDLTLNCNFEINDLKNIIPFEKVKILNLNTTNVFNILYFFPNLIELTLHFATKNNLKDLIYFKTLNISLNNLNKLSITMTNGNNDINFDYENDNDDSYDNDSDSYESESDVSVVVPNNNNGYNPNNPNLLEEEMLHNLLILFPNLIHLELLNYYITIDLLTIINENMNNLKILKIQLFNNNIENEMNIDFFYNLSLKFNKFKIIISKSIELKKCLLFLIKISELNNKTIKLSEYSNAPLYDIFTFISTKLFIYKIKINN